LPDKDGQFGNNLQDLLDKSQELFKTQIISEGLIKKMWALLIIRN